MEACVFKNVVDCEYSTLEILKCAIVFPLHHYLFLFLRNKHKNKAKPLNSQNPFLQIHIVNLLHMVKCQLLSHVQLVVTPWQPTRFFCPWDFPGKNNEVSCHFLLQGIFPTPGLSSPPSLVFCIGRHVLYHQCHQLGTFNDMLYTQCKKTYVNKFEVSFKYQPIYRVIDISNSAIKLML